MVCSIEFNLDPKIQIKYIDTKNQLADILTKGNFTRDKWNHLLCLFNISHFSSTVCSDTMAKRSQQDSGEERVTAKSRPMMNVIARTPSFVSSSTSVSPGKKHYGSQDPWKSVAGEDRSGRPGKGTDLFEVSDHYYHEQFMESFSSTDHSTLDYDRAWSSQEWKAEVRRTIDQGDLIKLLGKWYEKFDLIISILKKWQRVGLKSVAKMTTSSCQLLPARHLSAQQSDLSVWGFEQMDGWNLQEVFRTRISDVHSPQVHVSFISSSTQSCIGRDLGRSTEQAHTSSRTRLEIVLGIAAYVIAQVSLGWIDQQGEVVAGQWTELLRASCVCAGRSSNGIQTSAMERHQPGFGFWSMQGVEIRATGRALFGSASIGGSRVGTRQWSHVGSTPSSPCSSSPELPPDRPIFHLDESLFSKNVRSARRGVAGGPSGMTSDHMRPLLEHPKDLHFFVPGRRRVLEECCPMTALRKKDGGVRGIVVGEVIRRLVARTVAQQLGPAVEAASSPFQCALSTRAGCECILHALQALSELDADATVTSIDGISAYESTILTHLCGWVQRFQHVSRASKCLVSSWPRRLLAGSGCETPDLVASNPSRAGPLS